MTYLIVIIILLAIGLGVAFWQIFAIKNSFGLFIDKKDPKNIETLLKQYSKDVADTSHKLDELAVFCAKLHKLSRASLTKLGLIRFNPFGDTGGDQSFCLTCLDSKNNGFIISSIHARTGTRVYAKQILAGQSKHNLSDEEEQSLKQALASKLS